MKAIFDLLGRSKTPADDGSETIRRIAAELNQLEPARATFIAAFAYLLSRVARADHDISDDETTTMTHLVAQKGGLPSAQAALVVEMAKLQQRLFGGTDDFLVARTIGRDATAEQKVALVDCLFAVASADRRILNAEADEIGRIAREIKVDQADLSRLRSSYREFIEARKGL